MQEFSVHITGKIFLYLVHGSQRLAMSGSGFQSFCHTKGTENLCFSGILLCAAKRWIRIAMSAALILHGCRTALNDLNCHAGKHSTLLFRWQGCRRTEAQICQSLTLVSGKERNRDRNLPCTAGNDYCPVSACGWSAARIAGRRTFLEVWKPETARSTWMICLNVSGLSSGLPADAPANNWITGWMTVG